MIYYNITLWYPPQQYYKLMSILSLLEVTFSEISEKHLLMDKKLDLDP